MEKEAGITYDDRYKETAGFWKKNAGTIISVLVIAAFVAYIWYGATAG